MLGETVATTSSHATMIMVLKRLKIFVTFLKAQDEEAMVTIDDS